jgi:tetratricopeptide (TPR) repeat protein
MRDPQRRASVRELIQRPRQPQIAPVVAADQCTIEGQSYYWVRYEILPEQTLSELLEDPDPITRLHAVELVLNAIPSWWTRLHTGLLPMPADIVFAHKSPHLLALPFLGWPTIDSLRAVPERICHIAPEVLRGDQDRIWPENVDLYSFGAMVVRGVFDVRLQHHVRDLLTATANGTLFDNGALNPRLPQWAMRIGSLSDVCKALSRTVSADPTERGILPPQKLAAMIEATRGYLDPGRTIDALRASGEPEKAFDIVQEVLIDQASYDYLVLAGTIAAEDLDRPLEAIGFFERALNMSPDRSEAYHYQLDLLLGKTVIIILTSLFEDPSGILPKLDRMIERDFAAVEIKERYQSVAGVGSYFIKRKLYEKAAHLIYPYLTDDDTFLWWEFPRTLAYTEALIGMGRLDDASDFLKDIKNRLVKVLDEARMDPELVRKYQREANRLEILQVEEAARITARHGSD